MADWPSSALSINNLAERSNQWRHTDLTPTNRRPCCDLWIGWFPGPGTRAFRTASRFGLSVFWRNQSRWFWGARPDPGADFPASGPDRRWRASAGIPVQGRSRRRRSSTWRYRTVLRSGGTRTIPHRWRTRTACTGSSRPWCAIAWKWRMKQVHG